MNRMQRSCIHHYLEKSFKLTDMRSKNIRITIGFNVRSLGRYYDWNTGLKGHRGQDSQGRNRIRSAGLMTKTDWFVKTNLDSGQKRRGVSCQDSLPSLLRVLYEGLNCNQNILNMNGLAKPTLIHPEGLCCTQKVFFWGRGEFWMSCPDRALLSSYCSTEIVY